MTLIEVTAGILILSTLLVGTLVAFQQHARQTRHAQRIVEAVTAADNLLGEWFAGDVAVPRQGTGIVPGEASFAWRTRPANDPIGASSNFEVVRLEIIDEPTADVDKPWIAVEVVLNSPTEGASHAAR